MRWCKKFTNQTLIGAVSNAMLKKFTNQILMGAVSSAMVEDIYQSDLNPCSFQCDGVRSSANQIHSSFH